MFTHNFGATYQEGIVSSVDPKTHKVRCKMPQLEDLETAWLPFLTPNAGGNQFYCLPDVGELVALLLDARGEGGCVLGTIYNAQDKPPAQNSDIWMKKFSNGTVIQHNRQNGEIRIHTEGKVIVQASKVEMTSPCEITGDVVINGNLNVSETVNGGKVQQAGIELARHKHLEQGDGKPTSYPI